MDELTPTQQRIADRIAQATGELDAVTLKQRKAVMDARNAGVSWHEIGLALGVSKQAAHQRFGRYDTGCDEHEWVGIERRRYCKNCEAVEVA